MKRRKPKKRVPWRRRVKAAIEEKGTFDIADDSNGYKTAKEMIAGYLLKEVDQRTRLLLYAEYRTRTIRAFKDAVRLLEEEGKTVFKDMIAGKLVMVSLDDSRDHKNRDNITVRGRIAKAITGEKRHIELGCPDLLPILKVGPKLLEGKIDSSTKKKMIKKRKRGNPHKTG